MTESMPEPRAVLTIGHSTHELGEFIHLLQTHGIEKLVDVRTIPRSRRFPHFSQDTLAHELLAVGIGYVHLPGLGGLRHPRADSPNMGWRNASFRGFADYMQTAGFADSLESLIALARNERIAVMCAEAVPWRCHRSLIADALIVRGIPVEHIMSTTHRHPHTLTPFAQVEGTRITYPEERPPAAA